MAAELSGDGVTAIELWCTASKSARKINWLSLQAMTGSTSLFDESTTNLTTGILKKLNEEQAHCLPTG